MLIKSQSECACIPDTVYTSTPASLPDLLLKYGSETSVCVCVWRERGGGIGGWYICVLCLWPEDPDQTARLQMFLVQ